MLQKRFHCSSERKKSLLRCMYIIKSILRNHVTYTLLKKSRFFYYHDMILSSFITYDLFNGNISVIEYFRAAVECDTAKNL